MNEKYPKVVSKPIITTANGGRRQLLEEAWQLIPAVALKWFAKVFYYGAKKYAPDNWKSLDFNDLSASPINHAAKHLLTANELPEGSEERKWQLAKAGVNICMQLWYEDKMGQGQAPVEDSMKWTPSSTNILDESGAASGAAWANRFML